MPGALQLAARVAVPRVCLPVDRLIAYCRPRCAETRCRPETGPQQGRAMVEAATASIAAPARRADQAARFSIAGWLWSGLLLAVLAFLVLYPIFMLLFGALTGVNPVV